MSWWEAAFLAAAGVIGGLTGSIAGLASIATYPALLVVGLPPVTANVTNTVAMVFNAIGSVWGSRPELKGQGPWLRRILPVAALAGAIGAVLLLFTPRVSRRSCRSCSAARRSRSPSSAAGSGQPGWPATGGTPPRFCSSRPPLLDLCLRRLLRRRGGRVVDRAAAPRRPRDARTRQR